MMKLVCPHCAKVIDVPETAAGQTTNCSLCHGPLTVPFAPSSETPPASPPPAGPPTSLPPLPPPPPPPPVPDPLAPAPTWAPSTKSGTVIPPLTTSPSSSPTTSGGGRGADIFARLQQIKLPDEFHHWFGLGVLVVLFFLFFFPWAGVNVGDTNLVSQSGLAVAFGNASTTPKEGNSLSQNLPGATLLVFAFLATLVGLLLLIVILVERLVHAPAVQNMKPTLQRIAALKDHIVLGCLLFVTLIFLCYYVLVSFPLEHAAFSEKASDTMLMGLKLKTEGIEKVLKYDMVGLQWYHRRCWFGFATLLALVATLWVGCRWLAARGYTKRWPKVVLQWPAGDAPQLTFDAQTPVSELTKKG